MVIRSHDKEFYDFLLDEYSYPFQGWDFSHVTRTRRMVDGPLTWGYGSLVIARIRKARALLDMGTGGGELLASFAPLPALTCATESYKPNVGVAKKRLEPLGVKVFKTREDGPLPFEDGTFDLVINRHESYSPSEVFRVLRPGGSFVTQQVGCENDEQIRRLLGADLPRLPRWDLRIASGQLRRAGFKLSFQKEDHPIRRFYDVGALVYCLKATPRVIPDFSLRKYFGALSRLNKKIEREGYIEDQNHRFVIITQKPG
jgi:SAM-dependent methyltransferase